MWLLILSCKPFEDTWKLTLEKSKASLTHFEEAFEDTHNSFYYVISRAAETKKWPNIFHGKLVTAFAIKLNLSTINLLSTALSNFPVLYLHLLHVLIDHDHNAMMMTNTNTNTLSLGSETSQKSKYQYRDNLTNDQLTMKMTMMTTKSSVT